MSDDRETEEDEVGYGKPPKSGKFKKGVSGNPSGRPKKASDFGAELIREVHSPLTINENGKRKVIKKYQGIAKQLVNKAISGNLPAARLLIDLLQQANAKAAEEQKASPLNPNLSTLDARDLSDEQLIEIIQAGGEEPMRAKLEKSITAKLKKSIRAELEKSIRAKLEKSIRAELEKKSGRNNVDDQ